MIWQMLKAKYFPKDNFLNARKGTRPSWLWSSILERRSVLQDNILASIGNGLGTKIWRDPWISEIPGKKLFSPCPMECLNDVRVAMIRTMDGWDLSLIENWISNYEKEAIMASLKRPINTNDKWVWCVGKWNQYSVKEGYKVTQQVVIRERGESPSSSSNSLEGLWKQIWKLKVPHKIRSFMWRILSNALPTMTNLFRRGCSNTNRCLICTGQTENMSHLFCFCPWAHKCWFGSSFCFSLDNEGNFDFTQWLQHCLLKLQLTEWEKALLATTLWLIWKGRNAFVYDHRATDSIFTIKHAGDLVAEYWEANGLFTDSSYPVELSNNPETMVKWKRPIPGELKFNIDAAFDEQKEEAAIAFLVRDEQGWMLDRK